MKVIYNNCYGGFSLSDEASKKYIERGGDPKAARSYGWDLWRADPILVSVVEEGKANGLLSDLSIRDIPKGSKYRIDEYDGLERVTLLEEYDWLTA